MVGCASNSKFISYQKSDTPIKSVTLLRVDPVPYLFMNVDGILTSGIIGGLISAQATKERAEKFNELIDKDGYKLNEHVVSAIQRSLNENGIKVNYRNDLNVGARGVELKAEDFSKIGVADDFLMSAVITYAGFADTGKLFNNFEPTLNVGILIFDKKRDSIVYAQPLTAGWRNRFFYTNHAKIGNENDDYEFTSMSDITENFPKVKEGFTKGSDVIADMLAKQLK